ncbi:hypothetical protein F7725_009917, partial [Dissostichus mawsoni]
MGRVTIMMVKNSSVFRADTRELSFLQRRASAGVDTGVILQRANKEVWHGGECGEQPGEAQVAAGVPQAVQAVVVQAVADVAVPVDGDGCDVEDGADDAEAHDEAAGLAVQVAHGPVIVEDGCQDQRQFDSSLASCGSVLSYGWTGHAAALEPSLAEPSLPLIVKRM